MSPRRPNILFMMSDQHRADFAKFAGHPVVATPTLDGLAAEGVQFRNAYAASPVCVPGRQCMMAGQLPRTCRAQVYGDDLPPGHMTFARRLAQYGYETVCAGKLHHLGADQMQGWTRRLGWADMHVHPEFIAGVRPEEWARHPAPPNWSHIKEIQQAGPGRSPYRVNDEYTLQGALHFIEEYFVSPVYGRATPDRPLLLKVSFQQPHYPYIARQALFEKYLGRVELPDASRHHDHFGFDADWARAEPGVKVSEEQVRRAVAAYCAMIEEVDGYFGRVLQALRDAGQDLDDWIILYTSDHGDMMGQNQLWWKLKFYEGSVRVPLLVRAPHIAAGGRVIRQNVSHCDLFATLCDLAGVPVPNGLDSRSLVPLLRGEDAAWDNVAFSQVGRGRLMVKRDDLKYCYFDDDGSEFLFDLAGDPQERRNIVADPAHQAVLAAFRRDRDQWKETA